MAGRDIRYVDITAANARWRENVEQWMEHTGKSEAHMIDAIENTLKALHSLLILSILTFVMAFVAFVMAVVG